MSLEIKISMRLNESSKNEKCTKDGGSAPGRRGVCLGKVAGVWREEISLALNTTLFLFPSVVNIAKGCFSFLNRRCLKYKLQRCSETHQGKLTNSRGPGPQRNHLRPRRCRTLLFNDSEKKMSRMGKMKDLRHC